MSIVKPNTSFSPPSSHSRTTTPAPYNLTNLFPLPCLFKTEYAAIAADVPDCIVLVVTSTQISLVLCVSVPILILQSSKLNQDCFVFWFVVFSFPSLSSYIVTTTVLHPNHNITIASHYLLCIVILFLLFLPQDSFQVDLLHPFSSSFTISQSHSLPSTSCQRWCPIGRFSPFVLFQTSYFASTIAFCSFIYFSTVLGFPIASFSLAPSLLVVFTIYVPPMFVCLSVT